MLQSFYVVVALVRIVIVRIILARLDYFVQET